MQTPNLFLTACKCRPFVALTQYCLPVFDYLLPHDAFPPQILKVDINFPHEQLVSHLKAHVELLNCI